MYYKVVEKVYYIGKKNNVAELISRKKYNLIIKEQS